VESEDASGLLDYWVEVEPGCGYVRTTLEDGGRVLWFGVFGWGRTRLWGEGWSWGAELIVRLGIRF
jgi:hypothetical protein